MRVLILEDDSFKNDHLTALVRSNAKYADVSCASDVATAIIIVGQSKFDLIIVDMALPSHPVVSGGGAPMSLLTGGLEILFELRSLKRSDNCIIVTQYPEIEIAGKFYPIVHAASAIRKQFSCEVVGCLQYSEGSVEWISTFIGLLKRYENLTS